VTATLDFPAIARSSPAGLAMIATRGRYSLPSHLKRLNYELTEIAAGRNDRLIVSIAPRHGKTWTTSVFFPAFLLGTAPDDPVGLASYGANLAEFNSEQARAVIRDWGPTLYGVRLDPSMGTRNLWRIAGHRGYCLAAGVGGSWTGFGVKTLVLDDPFQGYEDANSPVQREHAHEWYSSVAFTRLEPGGAIVQVATRWHEDDIAGRRIREEGTQDQGGRWRVLNLPAIAEANDPIGRPVGAALWPARYDEAQLLEIKTVLGSYYWDALYRGQPTQPGGAVFKQEWFRYFSEYPDVYELRVPSTGQVRRVPKSICRKGLFVDLVASTKTSADYFVIGTIAFTPSNDMLVLDIVRTRVEGPDQLGLIWAARERSNASFVGLESAGFQLTALQTAIRSGLPAIELKADTDKFSRALTPAARYEAGTVYHRAGAAWLPDFETELMAFRPAGSAHDDQVDIMGYAARWLIEQSSQGVATMGTRGRSPGYGL